MGDAPFDLWRPGVLSIANTFYVQRIAEIVLCWAGKQHAKPGGRSVENGWAFRGASNAPGRHVLASPVLVTGAETCS